MGRSFTEAVHRPVLIRDVTRGFVDTSGLETWWREMSDLDAPPVPLVLGTRWFLVWDWDSRISPGGCAFFFTFFSFSFFFSRYHSTSDRD
jgi:hypothetical protein